MGAPQHPGRGALARGGEGVRSRWPSSRTTPRLPCTPWCKWDGRPFDVTAPSKHSHPRINAHRSTSIERVVFKGIPVTPKLRTVIDLATSPTTRPSSARCGRRGSPADELEQLPRSILDLGPSPPGARPRTARTISSSPSGLRPPEEVNAPYRLPSGTVYPRPPLAGVAADRRGRQRRMARRSARPIADDASARPSSRRRRAGAPGDAAASWRAGGLGSSLACAPRGCPMRELLLLGARRVALAPLTRTFFFLTKSLDRRRRPARPA